MKSTLTIVAALVLVPLTALHAGDAPIETDTRLHADGKGWRLDKSRITDPKRPRVLLIGDSILSGYLKATLAALDGKAHVDAWVNPYNQSEQLNNKILPAVLANGPYDVIHFNMGLHGWQEGRIKPGTFEPLTKGYIEAIRAKLPKAKIIWASSTPVTKEKHPTELEPDINPVIVEHNRMAAKVMAEMKVPVNDFYSLLVGKLELARGDRFHWTPPAYKLLSDLCAASVLRELGIPVNEAAATPTGEPTNAAEAAAQKAKENAEIEDRYQALVAKLPSDQQAWERVLQSQLGSFYLPLHKRDKIAGRSNAWDFVPDDPKMPRVLLIGDSVSRGYTQATRKTLASKANVHRAPANCGPTASGIKNIDVWLGDGSWDVIHFNFGIHDRNTPIVDYIQRLEQLVERMKKTGAKLIWASTTPIPDDLPKQQTAASIVERNRAAVDLMRKHGIAINDLFAAITPHLAEMQNANDVHFKPQGYDFLGERVAEAIETALK